MERVHYERVWQQDMAAASENLLLEAANLGLGAVWLGIAPVEERMNKRNNDPNNPYFYIPIDKYKEYVKIFQKPTSNEGEFIGTKIDTRI